MGSPHNDVVKSIYTAFIPLKNGKRILCKAVWLESVPHHREAENSK